MKWFAVTGSWKVINANVKHDVEETVSRIISNGDGIVTGGAPGVDFFATQVVLENGNPEKQLKIYTPIKIEAFIEQYAKWGISGAIRRTVAEAVERQLAFIAKKHPSCVFDDSAFSVCNEESYYSRNAKIVEACDEVYAFQINKSKGTQDAIDKAAALGKKIHLKEYQILV